MTTMRLTASEVRDDYVPGFDEAAFRALAGHGREPDILSKKREEAFGIYRCIPSPTTRDEEWRRTDPATFSFAGLKRLPDLVAGPLRQKSPWDDQFDVVVSVSDDRLSMEDPSGVLGTDRAQVMLLADAARTIPGVVEQYLQGAAQPDRPRKFAMLNDAFWNAGLVVHIPRKTTLDRGILIRYQHKAHGGILLPRLLVVVEEQSEVKLVEHFHSDHGAQFLCISSREMYVGRGASLKLTSLQEWGANTRHIGEDWARVERDGKVDWNTISLGGKVSKIMVGCNVCEPNGNALLSGLFFADGDQHFDQGTLQLHAARDTHSNLLYKGAVKDRGYSVYQGIIHAKPGAIGVEAYQMNNNLVLNDGARADSLPSLEIDADDLKCSHGSTIGTLDREQLFYLRSRGLSDVEARRILVAGFFEDVVAKVPYAFLQERLREHIERKIGK
ncbi:MAG: Fe-S cluster assembly protein SufD [bacterium]